MLDSDPRAAVRVLSGYGDECPYDRRKGPMNRPSSAHLERARHLLALESGGGTDEVADAAGRVFHKLDARLTPLIGTAGVRALLARSAKLTRSDFDFLEISVLESSTTLSACLKAQDPIVATEAAVALFGTFFALITTFIGERLTAQALRTAWPILEAKAPRETKT